MVDKESAYSELDKLIDQSGFESLVRLLNTEDLNWGSGDIRVERIRRAFDKAFEGLEDLDQTIELWYATGDHVHALGLERDTRLNGKMLSFCSSKNDVESVYDNIVDACFGTEALQHRDFIRQLFDRADELGYPEAAEVVESD